jgi:5-formyltetrahydrofolate cyclo-ligase
MQDSIGVRAALRRYMKAQRRQLDAADRERRARQIARALRRARILRPGRRVAVYSAIGGEVPLDPIVREARRIGCELYLPRIVSWRAHRMHFIRWDAATPLRPHRLGMVEPTRGAAVPARALDVVLLPALAVDARGIRLGMGAGFYDRSFAHRRRSKWLRPRLIAVVYDFQRVASIPAHSFDVPVDAVLSESGLRWFRGHPSRECV